MAWRARSPASRVGWQLPGQAQRSWRPSIADFMTKATDQLVMKHELIESWLKMCPVRYVTKVIRRQAHADVCNSIADIGLKNCQDHGRHLNSGHEQYDG